MHESIDGILEPIAELRAARVLIDNAAEILNRSKAAARKWEREFQQVAVFGGRSAAEIIRSTGKEAAAELPSASVLVLVIVAVPAARFLVFVLTFAATRCVDRIERRSAWRIHAIGSRPSVAIRLDTWQIRFESHTAEVLEAVFTEE
jgi:hypothetical protein